MDDALDQNRLAPWLVPILLIATTLVAAAIDFYHIGALSFWGDEIDTMLFSGKSIAGMIAAVWPQEFNMALYYALVHFWSMLFAHPAEGQLRALSALFSAATIPAVFLLGREVARDKRVGDWIGLVAGALVALNAYLVEYAQELRSYSLMPLLAAVSTLLLIKAVKEPDKKRWWAWYAAASVAGVYVHYFLVLLTAAQAVSLVVLLFSQRPPVKAALTTYACVAICSIPAAVAALTAGTGYLSWIGPTTLYTVLQFMVSASGGEGAVLLALYLVALVTGVWFLRPTYEGGGMRAWMTSLLISGLLLPVMLVIVESKLATPLFNERYFIFVIPFLAVFAAAGIVGLARSGYWPLQIAGAALFIILLSLSALGVKNYFATYQKDDWRGAAETLSANCGSASDLRVYFPQWTALYAPYYDPALAAQNADLENALITPQIEQFAAALPRSYAEVCLVSSQDYSAQVTQQIAQLQAAIRARYPNAVSALSVYGIEVDIYRP